VIKRAKILLSWHAGDEIFFSDKNMFVLEQQLNVQNDRVWSVSLSAVKVFGSISGKGHLPLVFIDRGVKIRAEYYKTVVLERILLPDAQKLNGDEYDCFQQDGVPPHTANIV
jgi:hypothetical protein